MTSAVTKASQSESLQVEDVFVYNSSNIHFGNEVEYDGPVRVQQYVTGLPEELAAKPEVSQGLAKAGLIAASNAGNPVSTPSMTLLLPNNKSTQSRCQLLVRWCVCGVLLILVIVLAITLALMLTAAPSNTGAVVAPPDSEAAYNPFYNTDNNVTLSGKLRIISRLDWFARPTNVLNISSNAHYVIITETNGDPCLSEAVCKSQAKSLQERDMKLNLTDIAPTFILAGDGYAYEGRGWGVTNQCTLIPKYDQNSICLAFTGSFPNKYPSKKQLLAAKQIIDMGLSNKQIVKNYIVYGLKQINLKSKYPTKMLYNLIQDWPNWRPDLD